MAELKHDDVGAITSTPGYWPHRKPKPHAPPRIDDTQRANQRALRLAQTIKSEIIPRLLLANSASQQKVFKGFRSHRITAGDVTALADTVVGDDLAGATAYVEDLLASGVALESIFLDLLAPAAVRLGRYWIEDTCTFADVTIGMTRLQQLLRIYSSDFERDTPPWSPGRRALLIPPKNTQHTFGIAMLEVFLRRAGWDVVRADGLRPKDQTALVARERFDVICLSASCDVLLEEMGSDIRSLRRASTNKAVGIMVGGPAFAQQPDRVALVGADATAVDAREAVLQAERFLGNSARRW